MPHLHKTSEIGKKYKHILHARFMQKASYEQRTSTEHAKYTPLSGMIRIINIS